MTIATQDAPEAGKPGLKRSLNLPLLVLYGLGTTIGAGIYVLVGAAAGRAGIYAPMAFIVATIGLAPTAISYGELASPLSGERRRGCLRKRRLRFARNVTLRRMAGHRVRCGRVSGHCHWMRRLHPHLCRSAAFRVVDGRDCVHGGWSLPGASLNRCCLQPCSRSSRQAV